MVKIICIVAILAMQTGCHYQKDSVVQEIIEDVVEDVVEETTGLPVEGQFPGDTAHEKNNPNPRPTRMFGTTK